MPFYELYRQVRYLCCPNTEVKKFTNLRSAERYASLRNRDFTYENPREAKNYHHTPISTFIN